jgi:enamine deaminase RidA (YjgF/YER057c/UK114 family)
MNVTYKNPPGCAPAQGLYSHATVINGGTTVFIAGQLSVGADGAVVGKGSFEQQFAQVFQNLGDVLQGLGGSYADVVKFTTFLVHSQDIDQFMVLRKALFPKLFQGGVYPPNTLLVVDRLVKEEFVIEVEAVAAIASPR